MLPRVVPRLFGYAHSCNIESLYWRIGKTSPFSLVVSYFWVLREGNIKIMPLWDYGEWVVLLIW